MKSILLYQMFNTVYFSFISLLNKEHSCHSLPFWIKERTILEQRTVPIGLSLLLWLFCSGEINDRDWRFLLTGGVALENPFPNPAADWLPDKSWGEIVRASDLPPFKGFMEHFRKNV